MNIDSLERRPVKLRMNDSGVMATYADAFILGPFAIHEAVSRKHFDWDHEWSLTHIRTGYRQPQSFRSAEEALRFAEGVIALGLDWDFDNVAALTGEFKAAVSDDIARWRQQNGR